MKTTKRSLPLIDLSGQQKPIRAKLEQAWQRILDHGQYINGPEVVALQRELAARSGVPFALACSNGTDALLMVLMAYGIQAGDAVFLPAFTFPATAEVIVLLGAMPVFVDVDYDTYQLDSVQLQQAIQSVKKAGVYRAKMIISVDLFGQPADYEHLEAIASQQGVLLMVDAAQSFAADYKGRTVGQMGVATTISFYPTKVLSAYGDAGAILTKDKALYEKLLSIREHGSELSNKYDLKYIGLNARMDSIQAAVLLEKLTLFSTEVEQRQRLADWYDHYLPKSIIRPKIMSGCQSVWALYTVKVPGGRLRSVIQAKLKEAGIGSAIYYPKLISDQIPYQHGLCFPQALPESKRLTQVVLSLPMHAGMCEDDVRFIGATLQAVLLSDSALSSTQAVRG
jgi:dTDP-4-amino-4,6-dideoxygalactose transaminase